MVQPQGSQQHTEARERKRVIRKKEDRPEGECAILSWKLKRLPTPWFDDVGKNNIKPQEKGAEMELHDELEERNQSAAGSLEEGIEETLTLHRLGVYGAAGPFVQDDELP